MRYSQLWAVKHRVQVGVPLPFNIRDVDRTLLLARGQVVASHEQMEQLFARGALVDVAELLTAAEAVRHAPPERLPALWRDGLDQVADTLGHCAEEGFDATLAASTPAVVALIERDQDLAIFQVLRQEAGELARYGIDHAMHAAIAAFLVARRLGWAEDDVQRVFKVALTMNVSMFELQGQLASQQDPPTAEQLQAVRAHPEFSVRMLELAGVHDAEWLRAVAQHHEKPDGSGYPCGIREIGDLAALVQRADMYTTMLASRRTRRPIAPDVASRTMFMNDPDNTMTAALVKEFGVYPPGCFVRLASGETGVVIKRGPTVVSPLVAVLAGAGGSPLAEPVRRDTSRRDFAILGTIEPTRHMTSVPATRLMALAAA